MAEMSAERLREIESMQCVVGSAVVRDLIAALREARNERDKWEDRAIKHATGYSLLQQWRREDRS